MNLFQKVCNMFSTDNDTRFYYLSLIKHKNPNTNVESWSIHGLWPQYSLKKYPSYCKDVDFKLNELNAIIEELRKNWYAEKNDIIDDNEFWEHEYKKHGSCMFENLTEFEYFNKTLELFNYVIKNNLVDKYYDTETKKCLIPFDLKYNII